MESSNQYKIFIQGNSATCAPRDPRATRSCLRLSDTSAKKFRHIPPRLVVPVMMNVSSGLRTMERPNDVPLEEGYTTYEANRKDLEVATFYRQSGDWSSHIKATEKNNVHHDDQQGSIHFVCNYQRRCRLGTGETARIVIVTSRHPRTFHLLRQQQQQQIWFCCDSATFHNCQYQQC